MPNNRDSRRPLRSADRVYLNPEPDKSVEDAWWSRYSSTLTGLSPVSREVLEEDCSYIVDRGIFGAGLPEQGAWPANRVRRGLVMGSVQSGKTASMLGVSALSLDRGVDIVVVLAGTRLSLWRQTYGRLRSQLDPGQPSAEQARRRILVPQPGAELSEAGSVPLAALYRFSPAQVRRALDTGKPLVVVAMKNTDHLRALGRSLRESVFPAVGDRERPVHMLVLDDEADDGSVLDARVEAAQDSVFGNLKQIPRAIVDLWSPPSLPTNLPNLFTTYVGYTATPQANFLQEEHNPLAPREFIVSLRTPLDRGEITPRSSTYAEPMGIERYYTGGEVFYRRGAQAGLCMPTGTSPSEDLANSIRAFLVAGAIRLYRSGSSLGPLSAAKGEYSTLDEAVAAAPELHSMLVHPSALVEDQFSTAEMILQWAGIENPTSAREMLQAGNAYLPAVLMTQVERDEDKWAAWLDLYRASAEEIHREFNTVTPSPFPDWTTVKSLLKSEIIPGTRVAVVNSDPNSDDRPEYEPKKTGDSQWIAARDLSTIFVSGNVMARGLTLEGLTTTLFLRTSSQPLADTQMQMQRWFGYRGAYIELCRVFATQGQLDFFSAYHDVDEALRLVLTEAMGASETVPNPAVLQGQGFLATGKIANLGIKPLSPGPKPFIRLINSGLSEDPNTRLVAGLFAANTSEDVYAGGRLRGRILSTPLSLDETADTLDKLVFEAYRPGNETWQGRLWAQIEARVTAIQALPGRGALYRPAQPVTRVPSPVRRDDPYAIAAYMRLWSACLTRHVRGLFATDSPSRLWSMVDLAAMNRRQPRFWVGIRFGGGSPVANGALSNLTFEIPATKRTLEGNLMAATWGSNDPAAGPEGYRGDEFFDYYHRGEPIPETPSNEPPWRPSGADGQILFYINQPPGQPYPTVAVGISVPIGGPDQFAATILSPVLPVRRP